MNICTEFLLEVQHGRVRNDIVSAWLAAALQLQQASDAEKKDNVFIIRRLAVVLDAGTRLVVYRRVPIAMVACAASGHQHARVLLPQLQASTA